MVGEIDAISGSIATAIEEQGAATAEIARNVAETAASANAMSAGAAAVAAEAVRSTANAGDVLDNVDRLEGSVLELRRSILRVVRASTDDTDRRKIRRRPCYVQASPRCEGETSAGVPQDISECGCLVAGAFSWAAGQVLAIDIPGHNLRQNGRIVAKSGDALHILFADDGIASPEADRISTATIADLVSVTKNDHVAFIARVQKAVSGTGERIAPTNLPTHHQCRLGKWYDGVSDRMTLALPAFKAMAEPHRLVHDAGRQALGAFARGDQVAIKQALDTMLGHSRTVQSYLDAFGREFPATNRPPAIAA